MTYSICYDNIYETRIRVKLKSRLLLCAIRVTFNLQIITFHNLNIPICNNNKDNLPTMYPKPSRGEKPIF